MHNNYSNLNKNKATLLRLQSWRQPKKRAKTSMIIMLMALTFVLPIVSWAFDPALFLQGQARLVFNHQPVIVPSALGSVTDYHQGQQKLVIHIQDLHCHYEVQMHIAQFIENLVNTHKLKLVGIEGADRSVRPEQLRLFPIAKIREEVADYFVKQGKLSGAEYFAITGKQDIMLEGIETDALYQQNLTGARTILSDEVLGYAYDFKDLFQTLKPKIYNQSLLKFDQLRSGYQLGQVSLYKYARFLLQWARKANYQLEAYGQLITYAKQNQSQLNGKVSAEDLFSQLDQLDQRCRQDLYAHQDEQDLDLMLSRWEIIEKLLNLSATQQDLARYRDAPDQFTMAAFIKFIIKHEPSAAIDSQLFQLDQTILLTKQFYQVADKRSQHFVDNLENKMINLQEDISVLVTGGYHTEHVLSALKEKGFSYLSFKPKLTKHDLINPYFAILKNKQTPLERLLAQDQKILAVTPHLPQGKGVAVFSDLSKLGEQQHLFYKLNQLYLAVKSKAHAYLKVKNTNQQEKRVRVYLQQLGRSLDQTRRWLDADSVTVYNNNVISIRTELPGDRDALAVIWPSNQRSPFNTALAMNYAEHGNDQIAIIPGSLVDQVNTQLSSNAQLTWKQVLAWSLKATYPLQLLGITAQKTKSTWHQLDLNKESVLDFSSKLVSRIGLVALTLVRSIQLELVTSTNNLRNNSIQLISLILVMAVLLLLPMIQDYSGLQFVFTGRSFGVEGQLSLGLSMIIMHVAASVPEWPIEPKTNDEKNTNLLNSGSLNETQLMFEDDFIPILVAEIKRSKKIKLAYFILNHPRIIKALNEKILNEPDTEIKILLYGGRLRNQETAKVIVIDSGANANIRFSPRQGKRWHGRYALFDDQRLIIGDATAVATQYKSLYTFLYTKEFRHVEMARRYFDKAWKVYNYQDFSDAFNRWQRDSFSVGDENSLEDGTYFNVDIKAMLLKAINSSKNRIIVAVDAIDDREIISALETIRSKVSVEIVVKNYNENEVLLETGISPLRAHFRMFRRLMIIDNKLYLFSAPLNTTALQINTDHLSISSDPFVLKKVLEKVQPEIYSSMPLGHTRRTYSASTKKSNPKLGRKNKKSKQKKKTVVYKKGRRYFEGQSSLIKKLSRFFGISEKYYQDQMIVIETIWSLIIGFSIYLLDGNQVLVELLSQWLPEFMGQALESNPILAYTLIAFSALHLDSIIRLILPFGKLKNQTTPLGNQLAALIISFVSGLLFCVIWYGLNGFLPVSMMLVLGILSFVVVHKGFNDLALKKQFGGLTDSLKRYLGKPTFVTSLTVVANNLYRYMDAQLGNIMVFSSVLSVVLIMILLLINPEFIALFQNSINALGQLLVNKNVMEMVIGSAVLTGTLTGKKQPNNKFKKGVGNDVKRVVNRLVKKGWIDAVQLEELYRELRPTKLDQDNSFALQMILKHLVRVREGTSYLLFSKAQQSAIVKVGWDVFYDNLWVWDSIKSEAVRYENEPWTQNPEGIGEFYISNDLLRTAIILPKLNRSNWNSYYTLFKQYGILGQSQIVKSKHTLSEVKRIYKTFGEKQPKPSVMGKIIESELLVEEIGDHVQLFPRDNKADAVRFVKYLVRSRPLRLLEKLKESGVSLVKVERLSLLADRIANLQIEKQSFLDLIDRSELSDADQEKINAELTKRSELFISYPSLFSVVDTLDLTKPGVVKAIVDDMVQRNLVMIEDDLLQSLRDANIVSEDNERIWTRLVSFKSAHHAACQIILLAIKDHGSDQAWLTQVKDFEQFIQMGSKTILASIDSLVTLYEFESARKTHVSAIIKIAVLSGKRTADETRIILKKYGRDTDQLLTAKLSNPWPLERVIELTETMRVHGLTDRAQMLALSTSKDINTTQRIQDLLLCINPNDSPKMQGGYFERGLTQQATFEDVIYFIENRQKMGEQLSFIDVKKIVNQVMDEKRREQMSNALWAMATKGINVVRYSQALAVLEPTNLDHLIACLVTGKDAAIEHIRILKEVTPYRKRLRAEFGLDKVKEGEADLAVVLPAEVEALVKKLIENKWIPGNGQTLRHEVRKMGSSKNKQAILPIILSQMKQVKGNHDYPLFSPQQIEQITAAGWDMFIEKKWIWDRVRVNDVRFNQRKWNKSFFINGAVLRTILLKDQVNELDFQTCYMVLAQADISGARILPLFESMLDIKELAQVLPPLLVNKPSEEILEIIIKNTLLPEEIIGNLKKFSMSDSEKTRRTIRSIIYARPAIIMNALDKAHVELKDKELLEKFADELKIIGESTSQTQMDININPQTLQALQNAGLTKGNTLERLSRHETSSSEAVLVILRAIRVAEQPWLNEVQKYTGTIGSRRVMSRIEALVVVYKWETAQRAKLSLRLKSAAIFGRKNAATVLSVLSEPWSGRHDLLMAKLQCSLSEADVANLTTRMSTIGLSPSAQAAALQSATSMVAVKRIGRLIRSINPKRGRKEKGRLFTTTLDRRTGLSDLIRLMNYQEQRFGQLDHGQIELAIDDSMTWINQTQLVHSFMRLANGKPEPELVRQLLELDSSVRSKLIEVMFDRIDDADQRHHVKRAFEHALEPFIQIKDRMDQLGISDNARAIVIKQHDQPDEQNRIGRVLMYLSPEDGERKNALLFQRVLRHEATMADVAGFAKQQRENLGHALSQAELAMIIEDVMTRELETEAANQLQGILEEFNEPVITPIVDYRIWASYLDIQDQMSKEQSVLAAVFSRIGDGIVTKVSLPEIQERINDSCNSRQALTNSGLSVAAQQMALNHLYLLGEPQRIGRLLTYLNPDDEKKIRRRWLEKLLARQVSEQEFESLVRQYVVRNDVPTEAIRTTMSGDVMPIKSHFLLLKKYGFTKPECVRISATIKNEQDEQRLLRLLSRLMPSKLAKQHKKQIARMIRHEATMDDLALIVRNEVERQRDKLTVKQLKEIIVDIQSDEAQVAASKRLIQLYNYSLGQEIELDSSAHGMLEPFLDIRDALQEGNDLLNIILIRPRAKAVLPESLKVSMTKVIDTCSEVRQRISGLGLTDTVWETVAELLPLEGQPERMRRLLLLINSKKSKRANGRLILKALASKLEINDLISMLAVTDSQLLDKKSIRSIVVNNMSELDYDDVEEQFLSLDREIYNIKIIEGHELWLSVSEQLNWYLEIENILGEEKMHILMQGFVVGFEASKSIGRIEKGVKLSKEFLARKPSLMRGQSTIIKKITMFLGISESFYIKHLITIETFFSLVVGVAIFAVDGNQVLMHWMINWTPDFMAEALSQQPLLFYTLVAFSALHLDCMASMMSLFADIKKERTPVKNQVAALVISFVAAMLVSVIWYGLHGMEPGGIIFIIGLVIFSQTHIGINNLFRQIDDRSSITDSKGLPIENLANRSLFKTSPWHLRFVKFILTPDLTLKNWLKPVHFMGRILFLVLKWGTLILMSISSSGQEKNIPAISKLRELQLTMPDALTAQNFDLDIIDFKPLSQKGNWWQRLWRGTLTGDYEFEQGQLNIYLPDSLVDESHNVLDSMLFDVITWQQAMSYHQQRSDLDKIIADSKVLAVLKPGLLNQHHHLQGILIKLMKTSDQEVMNNLTESLVEELASLYQTWQILPNEDGRQQVRKDLIDLLTFFNELNDHLPQLTVNPIRWYMPWRRDDQLSWWSKRLSYRSQGLLVDILKALNHPYQKNAPELPPKRRIRKIRHAA